ncbi:mechanosensitive ion channel family protein [Alicyclobacillus dauci]|uniref:Mechanosensitive ion channel family protein n=1 Tax=Alicyclobacillus dauci TaxID=1475485 RepID=A0ABY6Z272_9BACL|nr:mechanosensitive ion channel family protein [Alicyclobacillus dauci]WAH36994.1 mechanosensitive ion channel family protein [Alicyclobacillus dauci]
MGHFWDVVKADFIKNMPNAEVIIWDIVKVVIFLILARIIINIAKRIVARLFNMQRVRMDKRRKDTLESLFDNVIRYTVYFLLIVEILSTFHVNIAALLAGAGIVGLAVGFGAQSIIKDILTGLFILFEDQYGVGDTVQINNFTGTVIFIGVRLTRVQAWTGEVEVIPNGQITTVRNFSRTNSMAVIDIGVAYGANLKQAMATIEHVMHELQGEEENIVGVVSVLGVQALRDSDVLIRATAECAPTTQFAVQRKAQQRIKEAFDAAGIEIPFPQQTVWLQTRVSDSAHS